MVSPKKALFITSYVWMFGSTKKAAAEAYKKHLEAKSNGYIDAVIACFLGNAKRCFSDD